MGRAKGSEIEGGGREVEGEESRERNINKPLTHVTISGELSICGGCSRSVNCKFTELRWSLHVLCTGFCNTLQSRYEYEYRKV